MEPNDKKRKAAPACMDPGEKRKLHKILCTVPGLADTIDMLEQVGIASWHHWGEMDSIEWRTCAEYLPMKRVWEPQDLQDPSRLGPGHFQSLDDLRFKGRQYHLKRLNSKSALDDES